jgi:hypothetical protein
MYISAISKSWYGRRPAAITHQDDKATHAVVTLDPRLDKDFIVRQNEGKPFLLVIVKDKVRVQSWDYRIPSSADKNVVFLLELEPPVREPDEESDTGAEEAAANYPGQVIDEDFGGDDL